MINLTQYSEIVRKAMADNRKADSYNSWSTKAINKSNIKFNWSYLTKAEEFILTVEECESETWVKVELPCGAGDTLILVGDDRWSDAKTVEDGIHMAITAAARKAMHLF